MRGFAERNEEGNGCEDAEAAVDDAPGERDAANGAGDEREGEDSGASDEAELQHPFIADGVDEWTDECDGENKVGECEPVGAVGEEWGVDAVLVECVMDAVDPEDDSAGEDRVGGEESGEPASFVFEREGSDAAEDEAGDEEREPEADGAKVRGWLHSVICGDRCRSW